ncbi:MAG: type I methionyl aminopeptidase [Bacteroidales bacterium]|nr:type I methionyl aminopeptidase [Bacteroidales bacterium]
MIVKTLEEIELIRESSLLVGKTLAEVAKILRPGVKTIELDRVAETFIRDNGAVPGFKGYGDFPATLCISINEQVVHGIPSDREVKDGDLVSIDCGTYLNGYYGDYAYSFAVGEVEDSVRQLLRATKESLYLGAAQAVVGKRIGDIGNAIQSYVESFGYSVVRDLVGHGIGKNLHEKPDVFNYGRKGTGKKLLENIVICIEPMINLGEKEIVMSTDGWTISTFDSKPSAHFEHTVVVKHGQPEFLSTYDYINEVLSQNQNIE